MIWVFLPHVGLAITAYAFLAGYAIYFVTALALTRKLHKYRMARLTRKLILLHVGLAASLLVISQLSTPAGLVAAPLLASATGILGLRSVLTKIGTEGRLASSLTRVFVLIRWPIKQLTPE